jgi:membrane associated rhomboid family serine protease
MFIPLKDYNPTRRLPVVTLLLILLNFSVFIYQSYLSEAYRQKPLLSSDLQPLAWPSSLEYFVINDGLIPREIRGLRNVEIPVGTDRWGNTVIFQRRVPPLLSLLFAIFMHGSWLHLLGNMLFLWIFGNNVEDRLGPLKFILFYILCGVGASLAHVLFNLDSLTPVIGASGAVSGVMGAYLLLFPTARIRTLIFVFILVTTMDIPAAVFLVIWFVIQFFYAGGGASIAWLAHVGGFIAGMILLKVFLARKQPPLEVLPDPR